MAGNLYQLQLISQKEVTYIIRKTYSILDLLGAIGDAPTAEEKMVQDASIAGDRKTLIADSAIPAAMAVIFLLLLLYFKSIGGYKPIHLADLEGDT